MPNTWKRKVIEADSIIVMADGEELDIMFLAKDGSVFAAGSFQTARAIEFMKTTRAVVDKIRRHKVDLQ